MTENPSRPSALTTFERRARLAELRLALTRGPREQRRQAVVGARRALRQEARIEVRAARAKEQAELEGRRILTALAAKRP